MKLFANSFPSQRLFAAFNTVLPYHLPPLAVGTLIAFNCLAIFSQVLPLSRIEMIVGAMVLARAAAASAALVRVLMKSRSIHTYFGSSGKLGAVRY